MVLGRIKRLRGKLRGGDFDCEGFGGVVGEGGECELRKFSLIYALHKIVNPLISRLAVDIT